MKKLLVYLVAITLVFGMSCAGNRTMVTQVSDASYLVFYGKKSMTADEYGHFVENMYEAKIDDVTTFKVELTKKRKDNLFGSKVYQVAPGKHTIKVYKNGNLIINKVIFISNQETMEFELL
ncbi:MAG: hypothetical protein K9H49_04510 [Bacteroidales bacterium]|nr:hypothetical protein [Bacteroidales bacterium]MCF8389078.1 hypothetical protein [Bacteroidales bacterium]